MKNEQWTSRVGDRVRVKKGHACAGTVYTVTRFANDMVEGYERDGASCFFVRKNVVLAHRPAVVGPIAYVKQTRPDVPYDVLTPFQQTGRIG